MNTTEFKVGQKWRVVDAEKFNAWMPGEYAKVKNGDILTPIGALDEVQDDHWNMWIGESTLVTLACVEDVCDGSLELTQDTQEYDIQVYEDGSWGPNTRVSISEDGLVTTKQNYVDSFVCPTEVLGDYPLTWTSSTPEGVETHAQESTDSSKDILWHIISRAERHNGHSQLTVSQMDLSTLITLTRMLDDYVDEFCEMRLSWAGDHMGYYTTDIYEVAGTCSDGDDKILMQVERVTGIS